MTTRAVSSGFGQRSSPGGVGSTNHQGIDIPLDVGSTVYAVARGTVTEAVPDNASAGTYITIDHGDGYYTRYLHLSRMDVSVGQPVKVGTPVGLSGGQPGAWGAGHSTGPHLHFEVWEDGKPFGGGHAVDPLPLLTREATALAREYWWAIAAGGVGVIALALAYRYRTDIRGYLTGGR
jgi:murein DD-endopeptidase MepM/ murein hydrolase activator NlpD